MSRRYKLTANEWNRIKDYLPPERSDQKGRPRKDNRMMVNGILWILRTGCQWSELLESYGSWQSVYARFRKWQKDGIFEKIFRELNLDADIEYICMDSTAVKVHESANGGFKKGESKDVGHTKCGLNTKIHALTDALGNPLEFLITSGNVHDSKVAVELLSRLDLSDSNVLADKAYGTNQILDYIQKSDGEYTIPPKSNTIRPWFCDWHIYKNRHVIECFFQKLKWFRRVATRYDKLDDVFLAIVFLASIHILLK